MSSDEAAVRQTLSAHVAQQLKRAIDEGRYQADEMLPGEREMCLQYGVSRTALREAKRELVRAGYIEARHGSGTYVRSRADTQRQALTEWLSNHENHIVELLEMRSLLEPGIAELAARRADPVGLEALQQTVDLMRQRGDLDDIIKADESFHSILAKLTGNAVVVQLVDHTLQVMGGERMVTLSTPEGVTAAADGHQRVVDAIHRGDPVAASQAMQHHLADAHEYALRGRAPESQAERS